MARTEYQKYLCSEHWKDTRKIHIEAAENKCERCSMPRWLAELVYDQDLHVHHKTYANLGNEQWEDLEVLCRRCHDVESNGRSNLPKLKPQTCLLCHSTHWDKRSDNCSLCSVLVGEPVLYHLCRSTNPLTTRPMWESFMADIALSCFYEDEGRTLLEFVRNFVFDTKASMAGGLPF